MLNFLKPVSGTLLSSLEVSVRVRMCVSSPDHSNTPVQLRASRRQEYTAALRSEEDVNRKCACNTFVNTSRADQGVKYCRFRNLTK